MSLAAAGARGSLITIGAQAAAVALRLLSIVVLSRLLAPSIFGLVAVVTAIIYFATAVIFLGLPMATAQATSLSNRAASSMVAINSAMGLAVAIALFLIAEPLATIYQQPLLLPIVQWLALVPAISGINAQFRQHLVRELRFGALSTSEVVSQAGGIVVAIVFAVAGATWEAIVAQAVSAAALQCILVLVFARWLPGVPGAWRSEVIPLVRIGMNIFGTNLLRNASRSVIVPALGLVASPNAVGQFDRAQQLTLTPINMTVDQLQRVVIPILSRLRDQPVKMLAYMQRFQLIGGYLTSSLFLFAAVFAFPITRILLGPGWELAAAIMQVMCIGAVFRASGQTMQWLFISANASGAGLRFNLWSQPIVAAISLSGLTWGAEGVAIASTCAWIAYWPASVYAVARTTGFSTVALMSSVARGTFLFASPVAAVSAAALLFPTPAWLTLAIGAALALLTASVLALVAPLVRRDLTTIWRTAKLAFGRR